MTVQPAGKASRGARKKIVSRRLSELCRTSAVLRLEGDKIKGEKPTYKVGFSEDLNRKVLQEFSMNVIGSLDFIPFQS